MAVIFNGNLNIAANRLKQRIYPVIIEVNFTRVLSEYTPLPYAPNSILTATAGARTIFSLPYLTCNSSFRKLEREIGILTKTPSSSYDHWQLFKDLTSAGKNDCDWTMQLVYFSKNWIQSILHDVKWTAVKSFSPKTQNTISTLKNLEDLNRIIEKFKLFIQSKDGIWNGSILQKQMSTMAISYIHTSDGLDITSANDIIQDDSRFYFSYPKCSPDNATPASSANFFRGCVRLTDGNDSPHFECFR